MYHLFVAADASAWDNNRYSIDKSRFLEYTSKEIAAAFRVLTDTHIEMLKTYPCLFAVEGKNHPMRLGRLTNIANRGDKWMVEFEIELVAAIPYDTIEPIFDLLDVRKWEMNRTHWAIKSENLLERLKEIGLGRPILAPADGKLPAMADAQATVTSVSQFVHTILDWKGNENDSEVFYRGHSDRAGYRLVPSILRQDERGNYLHRDSEHLIFRELLVSNYADFSGDATTLDHLVRMQHYSMPTRLLDISSNPLIALFFACTSGKEKNKEGEVIVFTLAQHDVKYFDSDTASCLANLARMSQQEKDKIDFAIEDKEAFNAQDQIIRLLHFIGEEKPFFKPAIVRDHLKSVLCVKGKKTNSRIVSQSGAFFLFGHDAVLGEHGNDKIKIQRIAVRDKARILRELDHLNINASTVYPHIAESARYIAEKFRFRSKMPMPGEKAG